MKKKCILYGNFQDNIQLIIPMSGIGKRFIDAGYEETKSLIDVDGYPIIKHVVDLFPGVKDVIFICNDIHLKQTNMRKVLNDISPNCRIFEVANNTKGPINAIHQIFDFIDNLLQKTGKIGEVVEIQNLRVALPLQPKNVHVHPKNKWVKFEQPKELQRLKNIFDWREYPEDQKEQWFDYIDEEFKRRDEGFWFINNGWIYFGICKSYI